MAGVCVRAFVFNIQQINMKFVYRKIPTRCRLFNINQVSLLLRMNNNDDRRVTETNNSFEITNDFTFHTDEQLLHT